MVCAKEENENKSTSIKIIIKGTCLCMCLCTEGRTNGYVMLFISSTCGINDNKKLCC